MNDVLEAVIADVRRATAREPHDTDARDPFDDGAPWPDDADAPHDGSDDDGEPWPSDADAPHQAGNGADADTAHSFRLSPRLTRAEMAANTISFLCPRARFLARGVSSLVTSLGGVGKTRLLLQLFNELSQGTAVFGCELLRPERPMLCLYIGAEDRQPFFNQLALPLLAGETDTLPFDVMLLPEVWPGFTLTPATARQLAAFLDQYQAEHGLDCVALDPMLSLIGMQYADMMKNPVIARAFFNDCLAPLLASQAFALISANHDSKAGAAVTGSADQQNAARCVLQLSTEAPTADGMAAIAAERHKDNLGFRFIKLVLERDPETLLLTWNEGASTYAYGAPAEHVAPAKPSTDPAAIMRYLCRQAARLLESAPPDERSKGKVEARLTQQAGKDGYKNARDHVRDCLKAFCAFQETVGGSGRTGRQLHLVGVRNPDADIDVHDDYLAGGPATDESA
jgi:hypothetical protein